MNRIGQTVLLVLVCFLGCSGEEPAARLEIQDRVVDLGVLDPGEAPFSIPVRNGGTLPLRVEKVESTCSCTQAEATPQVEPAGSGAVRGRVKVQSGPGGAELTLSSNDRAGPHKIRVEWFGSGSAALVPNAVEVAMKVGAGSSCRIEVDYPAGDPPVPLEFSGVSGLPAGTRAELVENNPVAIKAIPGVSTSMTIAPSPFVGKASLRIDLPAPTAPGSTAWAGVARFSQRGRVIELPLKLALRVDDGLRCRPEALLFTASDAAALRQIRRSAILTSDRPGDRFAVVEKPAYLDVSVEARDAGATTRAILTASIVAPPPPGEVARPLVVADSAGRRVAVAIYLGVGP